MTPEEYNEIKTSIVDEVLRNATISVVNPSFEECARPDADIDIAEGECGRCHRYHKSVYDACHRGELISQDKDIPTLLGEALDMLMDELGGNLIEKLSLRSQR